MHILNLFKNSLKIKKEIPPISIKLLFKEYSHNFINKTTYHNIPGADLIYTYNNGDNFEQKVKQYFYNVYNEIQQQVSIHRHVHSIHAITLVQLYKWHHFF